MPNMHSTLTSLFSDIADAIRAKTGSSETIVADDFPTAIANIPTGGGGITTTEVANATGTTLEITSSGGGANTCTLSISDDGIVASNFSSGTTPTSFIASGFDDINGMCVTYCKDAYTSGCIMWYEQTGAYLWATGDVFPTLYSCEDGTSSFYHYSNAFQDTSFTATVVELS